MTLSKRPLSFPSSLSNHISAHQLTPLRAPRTRPQSQLTNQSPIATQTKTDPKRGKRSSSSNKKKGHLDTTPKQASPFLSTKKRYHRRSAQRSTETSKSCQVNDEEVLFAAASATAVSGDDGSTLRREKHYSLPPPPPRPNFFPTKPSSNRWNAKKEEKQANVRVRRRSNTTVVSTLYAGPTFHNSPAPSTLPVPAFKKLAPIQWHEEDEEKTEPSEYERAEALRVKSRELMNLLSGSPTRTPTLTPSSSTSSLSSASIPSPSRNSVVVESSTLVPDRMATAHPITYPSPSSPRGELRMMTQTLRTLLKMKG
ncbi:uncharacterized protein VTP21DRAFT_5116 [Calcarisporiella thermophila]|uniref:uncharacterized protein n=1 Tax=Calcarisporiella thermophila TaxID=911321 RepID=UPI0037424F4C